MRTKFLMLAASLLLTHSSLKAQSLADIGFGYDYSVFDGSPSPYDQVGDVWGKFKDSSGTLLNATNSVAGIGYFTTTPTSFSADTAIFDDFVFLASAPVNSIYEGIDYPGELDAVVTNVDVTAASGKKAYLAVFKGITDVANYSDAIELGLVSAMTWDTFSGAAAPGTPVPLDYAVGRTAIDTANGGAGGMHIGSEVNDARFGEEEGFNYHTAVVPEPAAAGLLLGVFALLSSLHRRRRA